MSVWYHLHRPYHPNGVQRLSSGQGNNPDADRIRLIPLAQQDTPRLEREERPEDAEYRQQENQGYNQSELSGSLIDTSALGAIDIFSVLMEDDHTHEYIDPAFRFGRRKKKKRRRKL